MPYLKTLFAMFFFTNLNCFILARREGECKDIFNRCEYYASLGACQDRRYEKWVRSRCAKTCQFCECKDWRYGCCEDRKNFADGPAMKGCAMKLCVDLRLCDKYKMLCHDDVYLERNKQMKHFLIENCPNTCGYCKSPSPMISCEWTNPVYGCCWNGQEATGPNKQGCPPCADVYQRACRLFGGQCGKTKFYNMRTFLETMCPLTCGQCRISSFAG